MDKTFSLLGKAFVVLGIAGILVGAGYFLATKSQKPAVVISTQSPSLTSSKSLTKVVNTPTATITQSQATGRFAVNAGGIKPFSTYVLSGVGGWTPTKIENSTSSKIVLTKGNYSVTILQGAFGGTGCTFPGDKSAEMSVQLSSSTMIELLSGNPLRRGQAQSANANETDFTVCQKESDGSYGTITDFGVINYVTPLNPDSETLAEMDAMVGSLQKQ